MNGSQRPRGETILMEADVILHTVHSDLASLPGVDRKTCAGLLKKDNNSPVIGEFLQCGRPLDPDDAPAALEREYLLDGQATFRGQTGDAELQASDRTAGPETRDAASRTELNGKMGNGEHRGDVNADVSHAGNSSACLVNPGARQEADGSASAGAEAGQRGQCEAGNAGQGQAVPDTYCVTAGSQPGPGGPVGSSSVPASSASYHNSSGCSGVSGSPGHRDGGQGAASAAAAKEPDLVIEVGGQKINAHKAILAEKSDYFKARLSRDILKVKGLSYNTLSVLIDYIYTAQINVGKDNVVDVITGAKILQVPCAVQAATDSMSAQITAENCYEILSIAKKQRLGELRETAYRFMSDHFLRVLRDPAVYGRLTASERDLILKKRTEGRQTLMVAEVDDVFDRVGGGSRPPSRAGSRPQSPLSAAAPSFEENRMMHYFDEAANDWRPLTIMPEDVNTRGCGMCTMYNYLFVAGGIKGYGDRGKVSDRVFCYNPVDGRWTEVRPLNQARAQLKLVSMDGHLYAIGGECLFTVERYDPRTDRWTAVAPLPKGAFAVAHEATTCNGELYVSGGSLFYRLLRYEPRRDEWQECPYNSSRKRSSDMVALKSFIYRFDVNREQGVTVFKYNSIVKMWQDCEARRLGSASPFRCAVVGNRIFCINKSQTLQFVVEEESAYFVDEPLRAPMEAKGVLFPFVLSLPEKPEAVA